MITFGGKVRAGVLVSVGILVCFVVTRPAAVVCLWCALVVVEIVVFSPVTSVAGIVTDLSV